MQLPETVFPSSQANHPLAARFTDFIRDSAFPCVGAKSALSKEQLHIIVARDLSVGLG